MQHHGGLILPPFESLRVGLARKAAAGGGPGPGTWEMSDLGGNLKAWFSAEGGTHMTGSSPVTQWTDRSGNGRHLSSTTLGGPTYSANKLPCLELASKGFDTWASPLPANTWDCYWVGDPDIGLGSGDRSFLSHSSALYFYCLINPSDSVMRLYDNAAYRTSGLVWTGLTLRQGMCRVTSTTTVDHNVNAGLTVTAVASIAGVTLTTAPIIGDSQFGSKGFGDLHEVVFTTVSLSDADRAKVEGRLAWKWDGILGGSTLVTALPGGHTYKSAAP